MDLRGLDLNLLVVLDALLTERNVTRAGLHIHLSQSATSGALARLRVFFRDELLIQAGREMVLTPLAQGLVEPVRDILLRVQATVAVTTTFDPATIARRFTVMGSDYVMSVLLTSVMQRCEREAPGISFDLRQTTPSHHDLLSRGEIDFLLIPDIFTSEDHPRKVLFEDTHVCVVWTGNTQVGETISFEQYLKMGHVITALGEARTPSFEDWFLKNYGYVRQLEVIAPGFVLTPQLLIGTNRIATMHTRLAHLYATHLPLRLLPFPIEIPRLAEAVQWPAHLDQEPGSIWMRGLLLEEAAKLESLESLSPTASKAQEER